MHLVYDDMGDFSCSHILQSVVKRVVETVGHGANLTRWWFTLAACEEANLTVGMPDPLPSLVGDTMSELRCGNDARLSHSNATILIVFLQQFSSTGCDVASILSTCTLMPSKYF